MRAGGRTRTEVNRARLPRFSTSMKKVETAIASGNKKQAQEALQAAQPVLIRGSAGKVVLHRNMWRERCPASSARMKAL